ncbi:MAG: hypothetical protein A3I04_00920 [Nitrospinae bacterium RIFCSPLOWO2_02_FULL_39_110]|nr:MAG: hypothetical protein A2W53_08995 [Nitrospinae bacterium RIFCSPHIGHO2_02_39_11]OGW00803.1 MAG: hypothetical protein A3D97_01170 [Nitrospinae bacterium RIFCSPHIGHO2_12_FULL_39_42]OGW02647.1 MAG: hypothetical protein A2Z59_05765 [Nitrospinae bacterium RIFCSPLOWO2_02_39_17]OGW03168.1 MAG: hypothetical protein A3D20_02180 [Nitrospinae bacterium RIFCSPHIGHO2_02_FULL_39_82]OGW03403.1 MAG: hypothetical protein A3I04_00920 [Nitrospinae bacterium RIFCSPLOWO2_02_FULL_39_110]OGW08386.1 MAG: hypoth
MSLGLTLANNAVRVVFVRDAVYSLLPAKPDEIKSPAFGRHIEMLNTLKCRVVAEKESIEEKGIGEIKYNIEVKDRKGVIELIKDSDSVITY